jgi:hypothetical protein
VITGIKNLIKATWEELDGWMRWAALAAFGAVALLVIGFVGLILYIWLRLAMLT